jgi:alkylhydroperoxidase family enzyme
MTWLDGLPEGDTDWDRLASAFPEAFDALAALVAAAWDDCDPGLVELARLRIATLLQNGPELTRRSSRAREAGLSETKIAALPAWPTSPLFTATERACLALTEQFVLNANGVTDAQVAEVTEHLGGAGCYAFVESLSALETLQRACLVLGVGTEPGINEIIRRAGDNRAATEEVTR